MAFLQLPTCAVHLYANPTTSNNSSASQFFFNHPKRKHILRKTLSCRGAKDSPKEQEDENTARSNSSFKSERGKLDRRDILLGMGGLYGGTAAVSQAAFAIESVPVETSKCGTATSLPTCTNIKDLTKCCPPNSGHEIARHYFFPETKKMRERPAAQSCMADTNYIQKYEKALKKMKELPDHHPHSFAQQAAIHCAYCNSAYEMVNFPNAKIDVHFNWLFFPFHRWYLYFFEKIVGKYADDENFAIPYWNWDSPGGMQIPDMFIHAESPLYDALRNQKHQPPHQLDLSYKFGEDSPTGQDLIDKNLNVMYTQMVSSCKTPELFFGIPFRGGMAQVKKWGSIEAQPHTQIHVWTGDPYQPNNENMGIFYAAGRDPIFYSHHANVDRMWNIWKTLPGLDGEKRKDPTDPDWLKASFTFYDEHEKLVRVKVEDCLDTKKMGYTYQVQELPWLKCKPKPKVKSKPPANAESKSVLANAAEMPNSSSPQVLPKVLDSLLKVSVPRPKKSRSREEKKQEEEVLEIYGIEYDGNQYINFDVFINDEDELNSGPNNAEFAGTFSNVPYKSNDKLTVSMSMGISELLEAIGADDDENVVVALVPRTGIGKVTIGGAKITLAS